MSSCYFKEFKSRVRKKSNEGICFLRLKANVLKLVPIEVRTSKDKEEIIAVINSKIS